MLYTYESNTPYILALFEDTNLKRGNMRGYEMRGLRLSH